MFKNPLFQQRERRYKVVRVSPDLLMNFLFNPLKTPNGLSYLSVTDDKGAPLPDDLQVEAMSVDAYFGNNDIALRVWSSTFPIVDECCIADELRLLITRHDIPAADIAKFAAEHVVEKLRPEKGDIILVRHAVGLDSETLDRFAAQIEERHPDTTFVCAEGAEKLSPEQIIRLYRNLPIEQPKVKLVDNECKVKSFSVATTDGYSVTMQGAVSDKIGFLGSKPLRDLLLALTWHTNCFATKILEATLRGIKPQDIRDQVMLLLQPLTRNDGSAITQYDIRPQDTLATKEAAVSPFVQLEPRDVKPTFNGLPVHFTERLSMEPVGVDWDGQMKPLEGLQCASTKPVHLMQDGRFACGKVDDFTEESVKPNDDGSITISNVTCPACLTAMGARMCLTVEPGNYNSAVAAQEEYIRRLRGE